MTPRAAALARLLEDWEAGRLTRVRDIGADAEAELVRDGLAHTWMKVRRRRIVDLTIAGLAAARAGRG